MARQIEFWFDYGSAYSALAASRITDAAAKRGVGVLWKPFLLGPILATDWGKSFPAGPILAVPDKAKHMWRDLKREAKGTYLEGYSQPQVFPQNSVLVARTGLVVKDRGNAKMDAFSKAIFQAQFLEGRNIADRAVVQEGLGKAGFGASEITSILKLAESPENKERLGSRVEEARRLGIFGAPTFIIRGGHYWKSSRGASDEVEDAEGPADTRDEPHEGHELFWGSDRMQQALDWAVERPQLE